jgi:hypothetical protein
MKKTTVVTVVAVMALAFAGVAFAQMGRGYGMMGSTGDNPGNSVNVENLKKFQKETLSLREDIITKQAELANEYNKTTPDTARISELRYQIIDIQAKIQKAAVKYGIDGGGWGHGMMHGNGYHGSMGPGMMYGNGPYGYGCGGW